MTSSDVIHSFWVPNLHGKIDLIPTHQNTIWIRADRPGTSRGQCAEFCGLQHANMSLRVVAEAPEAFEAWRRAQVAPARSADTPEKAKGQALFTSLPCALCHRIRGTPAGGRTAPDLTHLATRSTLAAGTLPNTRGHRSRCKAARPRTAPWKVARSDISTDIIANRAYRCLTVLGSGRPVLGETARHRCQ